MIDGTPVPATLGAILAGGLARRMGSSDARPIDKTLIEIAGRPILDHIIERLASQCTGLVINANGDSDRFARYGLRIVPDDVGGHPGPLAGILAALDEAAATGIDWVVSVAGDTPFVPRDLVARLHAARLDAGTTLACAGSGGWTHPVVGLWPVALRHDLRHALVKGDERKIDRWTARHGCATALWEVVPVDPFFNVNEPHDVADAQAVLARMTL